MTDNEAIATLAQAMSDPKRKDGVLELLRVVLTPCQLIITNGKLTPRDFAMLEKCSMDVAYKEFKNTPGVTKVGKRLRMAWETYCEYHRPRK